MSIGSAGVPDLSGFVAAVIELKLMSIRPVAIADVVAIASILRGQDTAIRKVRVIRPFGQSGQLQPMVFTGGNQRGAEQRSLVYAGRPCTHPALQQCPGIREFSVPGSGIDHTANGFHPRADRTDATMHLHRLQVRGRRIGQGRIHPVGTTRADHLTVDAGADAHP